MFRKLFLTISIAFLASFQSSATGFILNGQNYDITQEQQNQMNETLRYIETIEVTGSRMNLDSLGLDLMSQVWFETGYNPNLNTRGGSRNREAERAMSECITDVDSGYGQCMLNVGVATAVTGLAASLCGPFIGVCAALVTVNTSVGTAMCWEAKTQFTQSCRDSYYDSL